MRARYVRLVFNQGVDGFPAGSFRAVYQLVCVPTHRRLGHAMRAPGRIRRTHQLIDEACGGLDCYPGGRSC
jgi:hypothetical protein